MNAFERETSAMNLWNMEQRAAEMLREMHDDTPPERAAEIEEEHRKLLAEITTEKNKQFTDFCRRNNLDPAPYANLSEADRRTRVIDDLARSPANMAGAGGITVHDNHTFDNPSFLARSV